jgi:hypothetical protein
VRPYEFVDLVEAVDLKRLRAWFPTPDTWDAMVDNLRDALRQISVDPMVGEELDPPLGQYRVLKWESGPVPNWDPWPDMRLAYSLEEDKLVVHIIGRRQPNHPNDVYKLFGQRVQS